jgi:hypothetical protein
MRLAILITGVLLCGCGDGGGRGQAASRPSTTTALPTSTPQTRLDLTVNDFRGLRADMTLDQVYAQVGRPARDGGSGIYILEYILTDGSTVYVGSSGKRILYVRLRRLLGDEDLMPAK